MAAPGKNKGDRLKVVGEVSDQVLQHFKPDPVEFVRVIFGMQLRPFQWRWWYQMEEYPDVLGYSCMRVGKTVGIETRCLYEELTTPDEELMVFAPKFDQAVKTFSTQYDIIERDPAGVINPFLRRNAGTGKPEFGKGMVQFINGSTARCFGVNSNFEGENATMQHVDELDDVPDETLKRVLGRATGKNKNGTPTRHRFTGVIWGKLNIFRYKTESDFFVLPPVDVYQALAAGYLERKDVMVQRSQMTDDEWLRTQCLMFVESRNFIWENWLEISQAIGAQFGLFPYEPNFGERYDKVGYVAFGLDMGAQGAGDDASEYSLQVTEAVGKYRRWVWGKNWPPDTSPDQIIDDICKYWRFFQPDAAFGDARDANLQAQINTALYQRGQVYYNWQMAGKNDIEGWREWARHGLFTPIHNNGRTKHYMYNNLQKAIYNTQFLTGEEPAGNVFIFPKVDREKSEKGNGWYELQMLIRELQNLTAEQLPSGYLKISRHKKKDRSKDDLNFGQTIKLGDDRPDGLAMSNYGLDYVQSRYAVNSGVQVAALPGF